MMWKWPHFCSTADEKEILMKTILILYLVVINLTAFFLMYADKKKAQKQKWRIRESVLFLSAALGGSVGAICGMYIWHHKTKHWYFVIGMPLILVLQILLFWFLHQKGLVF